MIIRIGGLIMIILIMCNPTLHKALLKLYKSSIKALQSFIKALHKPLYKALQKLY